MALILTTDTPHAGVGSNHPETVRAVRDLLARYPVRAGLEHNMPPPGLRHFLFTGLTRGHR